MLRGGGIIILQINNETSHLFFSFAYGVFNDALSISDYIASNGGMISE
jgi:hypothetical protein